MFLKISQNLQENTCARVPFFPETCNFIKKETLAQVFSCEFCEISKNTFLHRTPLVAGSGNWKLVTMQTNKTEVLFWENLSMSTHPYEWDQLQLIIQLFLARGKNNVNVKVRSGNETSCWTANIENTNIDFNPLSAIPTKWSNTLELFECFWFECFWLFCGVSA